METSCGGRRRRQAAAGQGNSRHRVPRLAGRALLPLASPVLRLATRRATLSSMDDPYRSEKIGNWVGDFLESQAFRELPPTAREYAPEVLGAFLEAAHFARQSSHTFQVNIIPDSFIPHVSYNYQCGLRPKRTDELIIRFYRWASHETLRKGQVYIERRQPERCHTGQRHSASYRQTRPAADQQKHIGQSFHYWHSYSKMLAPVNQTTGEFLMRQIKLVVICLLTIATLAITSCSLMPQNQQEPTDDSENPIHRRH